MAEGAREATEESAEALRERFVVLHEFVAAARARLDGTAWDYLVGGTETETAVRRNRLALDRLALRPRVLRDVREIDTGTTFLGTRLPLPVAMAPIGGLESFDPAGALATVRGAAAFGVPATISSVSKIAKPRLVEAAAGRAPVWFQLYVRAEGRFIEDEIAAAVEAGMGAFCLTVDTAIYSRRERDMARRFAKPWRAGVDDAAARAQAGLTWADVARARAACPLPLMLKGIMEPEDARLAVEHGVDVIWVSNHGGRQLDHVAGTLDVLPEIADAVAGRARIIVDGGICRGTDIAKALALGGDLVALGRLQCWALAAAGAPGLTRMLEILAEEFRTTLGLLGVTAPDALGPAFVRPGMAPVTEPSVLSAFPHLEGG